MIKTLLNKLSLPKGYIYLFKVFFIYLIIFTISRLFFLFMSFDMLNSDNKEFLSEAFWGYGIRYDISLISYAFLLPFLLMSIHIFLPARIKILAKIVNIYFIVFIIVALGLCIMDIPNFAYYNSRVTKALFSWTESFSIMLQATFSFRFVYLYFIIFIVGSVLLVRLFNKVKNGFFKGEQKSINVFVKAFYVVVMAFLIISGGRGHFKMDKRGILLEDSYFSDYAFINQLSVNPVTVFFNSFLMSTVKNKDLKESKNYAEKFFMGNNFKEFPVARMKDGNKTTLDKNVVVVLMESMSAAQMGVYGNPRNLTPYLDSLAQQSLFYKNTYSSGIHTHNGIYSTLLGHPTLPGKKHLKWVDGLVVDYYGMPQIFKEQGYRNTFYCGGDKLFDNMVGFLEKNQFDRVVDKEDFNEEDYFNVWGVTDNILLNMAVDDMDSVYQQGQKFLSVILTVSAHEGSGVPYKEGFKKRSEDNTDQLYEYSDWAIKNFMKKAAIKEWYNNTIFVFLADHGQNFNPVYEIPHAYLHIPMFFYTPDQSVKPHISEKIAMQTDVFPTLLGIMDYSYINNSLGVDLQKKDRKFAYFVHDNKAGCINDEFFMQIPNNGKEGLYKYKNKEVKNYISEKDTLVNEMKNHIYSMFQISEWMIKSNRVGKPDEEYKIWRKELVQN